MKTINYSGGLLLGLLLSLAVRVQAVPADCEEGPITIGNDVAEFMGVVYDVDADTSTWYYWFQSGRRPAISHVTFELLCPDIVILDAGIWTGSLDGDVNHLSKAGKPEPGSFPAGPHGDPTTGISGLKFDLGFDDHQTRNYYFTVDGQYAPGPMRVATKGGPGFDVGILCGPSADCEEEEQTAQLSSLGDRVWLDTNGDGIQDDGEPGVPGVTVQLLSAEEEVLRSAVTGGDGEYLFDELVDGEYLVRFVLPDGYLFTTRYAGSDTDLDSNAHPTTGKSEVVDLQPGEHRRDIDAGLVESPAAIRLTKEGVFHPGTFSPWDECDVFGLTALFNGFVFGDLTSIGGDTEGRLAVAGDAFLEDGYSVAQGTVLNPMPTYYGGLVDALIVGGSLYDGAWGVNGNIVYGAERHGPTRYMINGNVVRKQDPVTIDAHGNVPYDGSGESFEDIYERLLLRSVELAGMEDRGVVEIVRSDYGTLTLTGDDDTLNVFNVSAADWSVSSQTITLTAPESSTVVINVTGDSVTLVRGKIQLEGVPQTQVLVHYVDATSITIDSFDHEGSVLALFADLDLSGGGINGRAVIGGSVNKHRGGEFHNYSFDGILCLEDQDTPEPPSIHYTFTVENTGQAALVDVQVFDDLVTVQGGPITLDPGEVDADSFTAVLVLTEEDLAAGSLLNHAYAEGLTLDGRTVTGEDEDELVFPETEEPEEPGPVPPAPGEHDKADLVVQSVRLAPSPTLVGSYFDVIVRVANLGHLPAAPNSVDLWVNLSAWDNNPAFAPTVEQPDTTALEPGDTRDYVLSRFRAPDEIGTYHVITRVNRAGDPDEYSFGNNFGGATYSLEALELTVEQTDEGTILLTWNSSAGYYFFVERAAGLDEPFVGIADNLPATPPLNQYEDEEPLPGGFYRVWGYKP